jgi:hypothetical protein
MTATNSIAADAASTGASGLNRQERRLQAKAARRGKPGHATQVQMIPTASHLDVILRCRPYSSEPIPGSWLDCDTQAAAERSIAKALAAFESIKTRKAPPDDERDFETLSHALGISCIRAGQIAGDDMATNTLLPIFILGNAALRRLMHRRRESGVWCFDGPALVDLPLALEQYAEIVRASSPAQMVNAADMRMLHKTGAVRESMFAEGEPA